MREVLVRVRLAVPLMVVALGAVVFAACVADEYGRLAAIRTGSLSGEPASRIYFEERITNACGQPQVTTVGRAALLRQPYLQQVTSSSALLVWAAASTSRPDSVSWRGETGSPSSTAAGTVDTTGAVSGGGQQYVATLEGLQPASTYCYELKDADGALLVAAGFRTAPAAGGGAVVRFSAVADMGVDNADQAAVITSMQSVGADLVLAPGDIAYDDGTLGEYEAHFFRPFAEMLRVVPFFPASGNHEYHTADAAAFRQVFALPENGGEQGLERWYSFDWGDVHFVVLDTEKVNSTQADWLDADLTKNRLPWTIVALHRPPFSSGTHGSAGDVQRTFVPILERHHVPLVLAGHDHDYERTKTINGVTYVITGGGGGHGTKPVGSSSFTDFSEQVEEFVYGEVGGDTLRLHAIDATGVEFDRVVISRDVTAGP